MQAIPGPSKTWPHFLGFVMILSALTASVACGETIDQWIVKAKAKALQELHHNTATAQSPISGAVLGTVLASPSQSEPDYFYHWVRDGALVMDVFVTQFEQEPAGTSRDQLRDLIKEFARLSREQQQIPPGLDHANQGLGEPKFNVDGKAFNEPWGRPQNDGPALRAMTLIRFAELLRDEGDPFVDELYKAELPATTVIKADLEYVANNWRNIDFDLWEEARGHHFFTRLAQHRAMRDGARLARTLGDPGAADFYEQQAEELTTEIEQHWNPTLGYIIATRNAQDDFKPSQLDASIVIAALRTDASDDPLFAPIDPRVFATAEQLAATFQSVHPINSVRVDEEDRALQPGIGRYPEDKYDGIVRNDHTEGSPWFLCTAYLAELCYKAANDFVHDAEVNVNALNAGLLRKAIASEGSSVSINVGEEIPDTDARFALIIEALVEYGDGYLRRIKQHANQENQSMSEQFNRHHGFMQGAPDLTWSYAAALTAFQQRAAAKKSLEQLQPAVPVPAGQ